MGRRLFNVLPKDIVSATGFHKFKKGQDKNNAEQIH